VKKGTKAKRPKARQPAKKRQTPMPRGGRRSTTWTKATKPKGGRKKGAKDKVPRSFKGSIKAVFEEIASEDPELIYQAVIKGLKAPAPKSFQYLQLITAYIDGKPTDAVPVDQVRWMVKAVGALFLDVVSDDVQRRRFLEGMRRLVDMGPGTVIDATALQSRQ
jgi:hypothetical protein